MRGFGSSTNIIVAEARILLTISSSHLLRLPVKR